MNELKSNPQEQSAAWRLVKLLAFFLLVLAVAAVAWAGFQHARLRLSLAHARNEFSKRQFMRSEFWARRVLATDARNVEAARLMAEISEMQDQPAALGWRMRVVQLKPGNTGDTLAWAKCALRFSRLDLALQALKGLSPEFKAHSADYHELMAGCAMAEQHAGLAEAHFAKAAELEPGNPLRKVSLASFRLTRAAGREARDAAARELDGALADPHTSLFATRALLLDAVRSGDREKTKQLATRLRSHPEHDFTDDLGCLDAAMDGPDFHTLLDALERRAEQDAPNAAKTGEWLNARGMPGETVSWFARLPESVRLSARVQMMQAEALLALGDWNGLKSFLAGCEWGDGEFLRRAMMIRCERELSRPWKETWTQLVADSETHPPDTLLLAHLAAGWNWPAEMLDLLKAAEARPETASEALQYLWDFYYRTNETRELRRVAARQLELDPLNPAKKNNVAFLELLLDGASPHSERLALEASSANPEIPEWTATYAYALQLAGKKAEAEKTIAKLPAAALQHPGVALYKAIILAANGDGAQAGLVLASLNPAGMLPEERKLAVDLAATLPPPPEIKARESK